MAGKQWLLGDPGGRVPPSQASTSLLAPFSAVFAEGQQLFHHPEVLEGHGSPAGQTQRLGPMAGVFVAVLPGKKTTHPRKKRKKPTR